MGRKALKRNLFPCLVDVEPLITLGFLHSVPKDEVVPKLSVAKKIGRIIKGSPTQIPFDDGEIREY